MSLSTLCQRCGLCCDGNLFSHVPLQPGEAGPARRNGLDVEVLVGGEPALRQRCAALRERRCTLYAERPEGCRVYACHLFRSLAAGGTSLSEALSIVEQAHALLSALEQCLPPGADARPAPVMERARLADLSEDGSSPGMRVLRERAEAFLDEHFHGGPRRVTVLRA